MKHCDNCSKDFDTKERACPVCGAKLRDTPPDENESAEIITTMMLTGLL